MAMDQATELLVLGLLANAQQDVADGAVEVVKTRLAKAIDLIRNGDPDVPKVSYAPCITGKVEIGDVASEFMLPLDDDSMMYSQWGADTMVLGERVDLLEAMAAAAREWGQENLTDEDRCPECGEKGYEDADECLYCQHRKEAEDGPEA